MLPRATTLPVPGRHRETDRGRQSCPHGSGDRHSDLDSGVGLPRGVEQQDPYAQLMNESLSEHVAENRRHWDAMAADWVAGGERAWEQPPSWGEWHVPNTELPLLADDLHGVRAIELGCGTGYVSAWMRRRGAFVYAVDNSEAQLATARRLSELHGLDITWVHGNAVSRPW